MLTFVRRFIAPLARKRHWKSVCEIGASAGRSTDLMLTLPFVNYTIIDPCLDEDLTAKYATDLRIRVVKSTSLSALESQDLGTFDCILIDGDHNWYTVFNELRLIRERNILPPGGFIFFHDAGWPYARRDMYYQPDTVPTEFRLPYSNLGIVKGRSELVESGGINAQFKNARHEGGPRNGVVCAIEDFLAKYPKDYRFFKINYEWGLGVMQRHPFSRDLYLTQLKSIVIAPIARRHYARVFGK
jgi:Methyltransferase domain